MHVWDVEPDNCRSLVSKQCIPRCACCFAQQCQCTLFSLVWATHLHRQHPLSTLCMLPSRWANFEPFLVSVLGQPPLCLAPSFIRSLMPHTVLDVVKKAGVVGVADAPGWFCWGCCCCSWGRCSRGCSSWWWLWGYFGGGRNRNQLGIISLSGKSVGRSLYNCTGSGGLLSNFATACLLVHNIGLKSPSCGEKVPLRHS